MKDMLTDGVRPGSFDERWLCSIKGAAKPEAGAVQQSSRGFA